MNMPIAINTAAAISSEAPAMTSAFAIGTPNLDSIQAVTCTTGLGSSESLEAMMVAIASGSTNMNSAAIMNVITIAVRPIENVTPDVSGAWLEERGEGDE